MIARHSHPNRSSAPQDFIKQIYQTALPHSESLYLAETIWDDKQMVSIYLHRLEGLIQADTYLLDQRDTYAIVVDGAVMYAFNVGGFPEEQFYLFDLEVFHAFSDKSDRLNYLSYVCLGGDTSLLNEKMLIHLFDQSRKIMLEEFYFCEEV